MEETHQVDNNDDEDDFAEPKGANEMDSFQEKSHEEIEPNEDLDNNDEKNDCKAFCSMSVSENDCERIKGMRPAKNNNLDTFEEWKKKCENCNMCEGQTTFRFRQKDEESNINDKSAQAPNLDYAGDGFANYYENGN